MSGNAKENCIVIPSRSEEYLLPAFRASILWIENILRLPISMKCGFRGALASGVVLCRLLNAIEPGTIRRINQCPNRASATDNLSLFLCACEEKFEIPQSRMFSVHDFEDIFDQGVDANTGQRHDTKHSEKVVITLFWLAKSVDLRDRFNYIPKLDYNAFSGLLPKTLIQRKFSVGCSTSNTTSGDADDISYSSDVSSIFPVKGNRVPRRVSHQSDERLVVIKPQYRDIKDSCSSSVMGNPQSVPPHNSSEKIETRELNDLLPRSTDNIDRVNGSNNSTDHPKHTSVLIERMPQPPNPSSLYSPLSESGHAEIIITNNSSKECRSSGSRAKPGSDATPGTALPSEEALHEPVAASTVVPVRSKAGGISSSMPHQLNNNMIEEGEGWQSSLAEWRERRRKLSHLCATKMATLIAEEEAEATRRAEEVRDRLRQLKTNRSLTCEAHFFPLLSEVFSPPPNSPGIALLTGVGPKLSEIEDENEQQQTDFSPPILPSSGATDTKSVWNPQTQKTQPESLDNRPVMNSAAAYSTPDALDGKVNGHSAAQDGHAEPHKPLTPEQLDATSSPTSPPFSPDARSSEMPTVSPDGIANDENIDATYKVVKFQLQCKPGSREVRWGLTIRGEGPNSSAPFVVDHIKIGSAADLSEVNRGDILIDIGGQNLRKSESGDQGPTPVAQTAREVEQLMDDLMNVKKPISIRVLRKRLSADESSDAEFGEETSPVVSADEAPQAVDIDGSDVDDQVLAADRVVAARSPLTNQQPMPSSENGRDTQLIAHDLPREEIGLEVAGTVDHHLKHHSDEILELSPESVRPAIQPPPSRRTDPLDSEPVINTVFPQAGAPVTSDTT